MLKITLLSDLHLEHHPFDLKNTTGSDVLVLAGDILQIFSLNKAKDSAATAISNQYRAFLKCASEEFKYVIYVAGNHEFYNGQFHKGLVQLKAECDKFGNIFFLENETVILEGVMFAGCTLWTNFNNGDIETMAKARLLVPDYTAIRDETRRFNPVRAEQLYARHMQSMQFLTATVNAYNLGLSTFTAQAIAQQVQHAQSVTATFPQQLVIVTHHSPSFNAVPEQFKDATIANGLYHSDLDEFITSNPTITAWLHGHVHNAKRYYIGETLIACNPRGYCSDEYTEQTHWDQNFTIDLE